MEEGKGQGGLATSHQYGNALLGVCYQEEEEDFCDAFCVAGGAFGRPWTDVQGDTKK